VAVVQFNMGLGSFRGMVFGMFVMGVGEMGVVRARLMLAIRDERGGFAMMLRGLLVMLGGVFVMI
jgi:hypothetical protein